jgi:hypothetical protein
MSARLLARSWRHFLRDEDVCVCVQTRTAVDYLVMLLLLLLLMLFACRRTRCGLIVILKQVRDDRWCEREDGRRRLRCTGFECRRRLGAVAAVLERRRPAETAARRMYREKVRVDVLGTKMDEEVLNKRLFISRSNQKALISLSVA